MLLADNPVFNGFLAESMTPIILEAQKQFNFTHIFSNASAFGKVCASVSANCPLPIEWPVGYYWKKGFVLHE